MHVILEKPIYLVLCQLPIRLQPLYPMERRLPHAQQVAARITYGFIVVEAGFRVMMACILTRMPPVSAWMKGMAEAAAVMKDMVVLVKGMVGLVMGEAMVANFPIMKQSCPLWQ